MDSVVCSLFEKHYHYGVAVLVNSLYSKGYKGPVYVGYKGSLLSWTQFAEENTSLQWAGARTLKVAEDFNIHFLPVNSDYHLTNYKPDFMLELLRGLAIDAKAIVYFDPDIVVRSKWEFFEYWLAKGVALVHEVVNNPMPSTHPIRLGWETVIQKINKKKVRVSNYYFNAGFCGVSRQNIEFLELWSEIIKTAITDYKLDPSKFISSSDRMQPFNIIDQDALNITTMCCSSFISEIGPEGMDFVPGGWIMSHATGSPKPWNKNFVLSALNGFPPSFAEREYWHNIQEPIKCFSSAKAKITNAQILIAAFIGRFYKKH